METVKKEHISEKKSAPDGSVSRKRWFLKGVNHSRGYAKLEHISTGEKRYAALYDFKGYRTRLSYCLFMKASSAVARRKKVFERLMRIKAYGEAKN